MKPWKVLNLLELHKVLKDDFTDLLISLWLQVFKVLQKRSGIAHFYAHSVDSDSELQTKFSVDNTGLLASVTESVEVVTPLHESENRPVESSAATPA
jgi:hypothetical protein